MLGHHKNQFLREHLHLVLLFNGSESLIERKNNRRLLGDLLLPSPEGYGADGAPL